MDRIQLRRDSSARWAEINPILLEGELGYETDTNKRKIGDGVNRWNNLEYLRAEGIVQEKGNNENLVMSQKAVTRELTELGSHLKTFVPRSETENNNILSYIKDIYVKNANYDDFYLTYIGRQGNKFVIQITTTEFVQNYTIAWNGIVNDTIMQIPAEYNEGKKYEIYVRFADEITSEQLYSTKAKVTDVGKGLQAALHLNPLVNELKSKTDSLTSEISELKSKSNLCVYTQSYIWNAFFKELYLDKTKVGDNIKLYVIRRNFQDNWQIAFSDMENNVVAVYNKSGVEENGVLWIKQGGGKVGYAVVDWSVIDNGYAQVVDVPIKNNAFVYGIGYENYINLANIESAFATEISSIKKSAKSFIPKTESDNDKITSYISDIYVKNANYDDFYISYIGKQGNKFLIQIKTEEFAENYTLSWDSIILNKVMQIPAERDTGKIYDVFVRFASEITSEELYFISAEITEIGKGLQAELYLNTLEEKLSQIPYLGTYKLGVDVSSVQASFAKKYIENIYIVGLPKQVIETQYLVHYIGIDSVFGANKFGVQLSPVPYDSNVANNYYISVDEIAAGEIVKLKNENPSKMSEDVYIQFPNELVLDGEKQYYTYNANTAAFSITDNGKLITSALADEKVMDWVLTTFDAKEKIEIVVDVNGKGDYVSLRDCLDAIYATGETNQAKPTNKEYIVKILAGTYDVRSYYTQEEWDADGFTGLNVPRGVSLIGMGKKRDDVIITCTSEKPKGQISTLNFIDDVKAENLTVYGENVRYVIHDDYSYYPYSNKYGSYRRIKNVDFIGKNLAYAAVYGSGTHGGADWQFENVRFIANYTAPAVRAFSVHDRVSASTKSEYFKFVNCEFITKNGISIALNPMDSGVEQFVEFIGCTFYKIMIDANPSYPTSGAVTTIYNVKGYGNNKGYIVSYNNDIEQARKSTPHFSDDSYVGINVGDRTISFGDYVKIVDGALTKSEENDYNGIALEDIAAGGFGAIKLKA